MRKWAVRRLRFSLRRLGWCAALTLEIVSSELFVAPVKEQEAEGTCEGHWYGEEGRIAVAEAHGHGDAAEESADSLAARFC